MYEIPIMKRERNLILYSTSKEEICNKTNRENRNSNLKKQMNWKILLGFQSFFFRNLTKCISIIIMILHIQIQLDTKKSIRDCQEKRYFLVFWGEYD